MKREKKNLQKYLKSHLVGGVAAAFEGIFFPARCLLCNALLSFDNMQDAFCVECLHKFEPLVSPLCEICGEPLLAADGLRVCEKCLCRRPPYTLCRSLYTYNEAMRNVILQFKFRRDLRFLQGIQQLCMSVDLSRFAGPGIATPVPLHRKRLQERGFNQSLLLCKTLFSSNEDVEIVPELLQRMKNTLPQSTLCRQDRAKNLEKVFHICREKKVYGRQVYLIDDVMTTGATINECCDIIMKSGASAVSVLTLARAERKMS